MGRPSDTDPNAWFCLTVKIDQNHVVDEAFQVSHKPAYITLTSTSSNSKTSTSSRGCLSYLLVTVLVLSSGMTMLYVSSTPSLSTSFTCHVTYVMLTLPFHGISHMFMVAISQRSVYIPCLQLGEPQLELTCNTSSSLTCCSP